MRILTAIPVYNEAENLVPVLEEILLHARDVLVVDDGSTDRTPELLQERFQDRLRIVRHPQNRGYGAALASAFELTIQEEYDGLVTLDCDGQHEPALIPDMAAPLAEFDIVSGSRYLQVFDPTQKPPEQRRKINVEVTRWLNDCLHLGLTDAFCGFKGYRTSALRSLQITEPGYAMPLEVWVQIAALGLSVIEVPVPLIYLDEKRAFGGALDDAAYRLKHYKDVFDRALARTNLEVAGGCA